MSASTALVSRDAVKTYLGLNDTAHDDRIDQLIDAVSESIELYCGRPFARASRTEQYDGGGDALVLRCRPVASIESVRDDPALDFPAASELDASAYVLYPDEGVLQLLGGRHFLPGARNVRVSYTAGYETIPPAIAQAAEILVAHFHHRGRQGADGVSSETLGSYVVSYDTGEWPHQARGLLAEFRETRI